MKKTLPVFLLMIILTMNACAPVGTATPVLSSATEPTASIETQMPVVETPTEVIPSIEGKLYENTPFGLRFHYPANWLGPDEYVSGDTLRVAVGSDVVYPYGTDRTEQIYKISNSYYVVIQYTKSDQNTYWKDTYQTLTNLKDGESYSDAKSQIIRLRQLDLGGFKGFEYIATLSETAQTEPVYMREVVLVDERSNLLTISGSPNNVEINAGAKWREVYQMIDEANATLFHDILESITIN